MAAPKCLALLAPLLFAVPLRAQYTPPVSMIFVTSDPAGACTVNVPLRYNTTNGKLWGCDAGTWTTISGGGAGSVTVVGAGTLTSTDCVTGGGSQTIQTPSANCTVDSSGNVVAASVTSGGVTPTTSGLVYMKGLTSGGQAWGVLDVAGTAIAYILPSTAGTAGQVLSDTGATTCPTLAAGSPATCHLMAWVTSSATPVAGVWQPFGGSNDGVAVATGAANETRFMEVLVPYPGLTVTKLTSFTYPSVSGHYAFAFYDSSCNILATSSTLTYAGSAVATATFSSFTLPTGKAFFAYTTDSTNLAFFGVSGVATPRTGDSENNGESAGNLHVFSGTASTGTTTLVFPSSCGTRTAAGSNASWAPGVSVH